MIFNLSLPDLSQNFALLAHGHLIQGEYWVIQAIIFQIIYDKLSSFLTRNILNTAFNSAHGIP